MIDATPQQPIWIENKSVNQKRIYGTRASSSAALSGAGKSVRYDAKKFTTKSSASWSVPKGFWLRAEPDVKVMQPETFEYSSAVFTQFVVCWTVTSIAGLLLVASLFAATSDLTMAGAALGAVGLFIGANAASKAAAERDIA
jgi:hypothetical protein